MTSKRRFMYGLGLNMLIFALFLLDFSFKMKPVNRCDETFRYFHLLAFCLCKLFHTCSTFQNHSSKEAAPTRVQLFLKTDIIELGVVPKQVQQRLNSRHAQVEVVTLVFPKTFVEAVYTSTDKLEFSKISALEGVFQNLHLPQYSPLGQKKSLVVK